MLPAPLLHKALKHLATNLLHVRSGMTLAEPRPWAHASVDLSQPVTAQRDTVRQGVNRTVTPASHKEQLVNEPIRQSLLKMCEYHAWLSFFMRGVRWL